MCRGLAEVVFIDINRVDLLALELFHHSLEDSRYKVEYNVVDESSLTIKF